jgi:hypothetical protein
VVYKIAFFAPPQQKKREYIGQTNVMSNETQQFLLILFLYDMVCLPRSGNVSGNGEYFSRFTCCDYWCTVWANAEYLVRIISNLVKNAIVHNPPGTRVQVMVSRRRRFTVIRVLDTGRGIPEARGAKPLENFAAFVARCAQTGATGDEGSHGIGIASVANLCAELNGHMRLYARCHVGTIFEFMLEPARMPVK